MGNNAAFTHFEQTVILLYDKGALDPELLTNLGEAHRGTDIDHGGKIDLRSHDGFDVDELIVKVMMPERFEELKAVANREEYSDRFWDAVFEVTGKWGWI